MQHSTRIRCPEDDVGALKQVGVIKIYKILLVYMLCICSSGYEIVERNLRRFFLSSGVVEAYNSGTGVTYS